MIQRIKISLNKIPTYIITYIEINNYEFSDRTITNEV